MTLFGGRLLYWKKNGKNKIVYTTRGTSVTFGRGLLCHFRLKSPEAEGLHCKICVGKHGKIQIINYSTDNPVLVNDKCLLKKQILRSGDSIEILSKKFIWEYSRVPDKDPQEGRAIDGEVSILKLGDKKRRCKSEPGRRRKLQNLGKGMAVSILTPLRKRKITPIAGIADEANRTNRSAEEATLMEVESNSSSSQDTQGDNTAIEVSKSLYGTPMNSMASTLKSPNLRQSINLIDLNTPAPKKDAEMEFQATSDTSDIFKTPMRHPNSTRNIKTPATAADFGDLPQSTPIELPSKKILSLDESQVSVSVSVITIEDSDESRSLDDSVKFVPITPQRVLRSATKTLPTTPLSVKTRTPRSVKKEVATPTNPPRLTKRPATSVKKLRGSKFSAKLNCSDTTGEKVPKSVSEDQQLMTMENLADNSVSGKENISTPRVPKSVPRSEKSKSTRKSPGIRSPLNNLSNVSVKRLFPAQAKTPNLRGMRELLKTPKQDDLRQVDGVKELFGVTSPKNDLMDVRGVRKLFRTPGREKRDAFEEFPGVKSLMQEPQENNDLTDVVGVRELLATPKDGNRLEDLVGVRELLRTPLDQDVSVNYVGVRDLMREIPEDDASLRFKGVRELMKTPEKDVSMELRGVRQMMMEPPEAEMSVRLGGIREMMRSPDLEDTSIRLAGIKEMMKEPVNSNKTQNLTGLTELYTIPEELEVRESLARDKETSSSSGVVEVEIDATMDEVFDSLKGRTSMPSIKHTYSRKESPKKASDDHKVDQKGIQEWIDSIVTATAETTTPRRANNTLQVLSDKYSNVTPSGSKSLLPEDEVSEEVPETPARKETSTRVASLRKRAIVQSINLSGNLSVDFGEGVTSTPMSVRGRPRKVPVKETPVEESPETPTGRVLRSRRANVDYSEKSSAEKPRRGRKPKLVTFAEPAPPTPTVEESVKPKRTTRRKAEAEKVAEDVVPVRPKRTRKVAIQESLEVKPSPKRGRPAKKVKEVEEVEEQMEEEETIPKPLPKRGRPAKKIEEQKKVEEEEPTRKTRGRRAKMEKPASPEIEVEKTDAIEPMPPKQTRRRAKVSKTEEKKSPEAPAAKPKEETLSSPKDKVKTTRSRKNTEEEVPRRNLRTRKAK